MNIKQIKNYLLSKINSPVIIIYNGSRNRKEKYKGRIYKIYNNVFTIKLDNNEVKSFSYIDILIKTIQIYI